MIIAVRCVGRRGSLRIMPGLPPGEHERIWEIQKPLNFPLTVYGFERSDATMEKITPRLSEALGSHGSDEMMRAEELE
jgi:hypothetical protein